MKLRRLSQVGMLLSLTILSACSKQNGQPTAGENPPNQDASISLHNVYSIHGAYIISELENSGKVGIVAFQGKWTIKDDLDATVADLEIRYTSDTFYGNSKGEKNPHVISPGENFIIVNQHVDGQPDNVFATTKEDLAVNPFFEQLSQGFTLDHWRVKKKITFKVEKLLTR
jgi:hypothetical protein